MIQKQLLRSELSCYSCKRVCGDQWLRALSETETHYAQIEKETLALTCALERFAEYVLGKKVVLETDHKPLVPLLGNKSLDLCT